MLFFMRIIVGMSGGVDSSLTAALLKSQGHDVIGVTFQLYSYDKSLEETEEDKRHCHHETFLHNTQKLAKQLGIEHHIIDRQDFFNKTIVEPFKESYNQGKTPIPCASCNRDVKTALMIDIMKEMGAQGVATGHYVRTIDNGQIRELHKGADPKRDQSFFLFALNYDHLQYSYFPLGEYSKEETRKKAEEFGLCTSKVPASQDLCFISKKSYKTLFQGYPGNIVDTSGNIVGTHQGIQRYTLGQRHGLNIGGLQTPLYVVGLEAATNEVVVGPYHLLQAEDATLEKVNWLAPELLKDETEVAKGFPVTLKIRSSSPGTLGRVFLYPGEKAKIFFDEPEYALTPGQVCVFYQGTRVLGGGWIA